MNEFIVHVLSNRYTDDGEWCKGYVNKRFDTAESALSYVVKVCSHIIDDCKKDGMMIRVTTSIDKLNMTTTSYCIGIMEGNDIERNIVILYRNKMS